MQEILDNNLNVCIFQFCVIYLLCKSFNVTEFYFRTELEMNLLTFDGPQTSDGSADADIGVSEVE